MIAAIVVPLAWLNIASTFACLELERGPAVVAFLAGAGFRRALSADVLILAVLFFFDMAISSSVATASGAATAESPRRPLALAGDRRGSVETSVLRDPIDQRGCIQQRIDLRDQLLDIERDGYSLLGIAGLGTGLRRLGDARVSSSRCEISAR